MRDYALMVKILRSCAENSCENCPIGGAEYTSKDCRKAHNDAADAIEELMAKVPKWISVDERLPEDEGKRYLVASDLMICGLWVSICYFTHNLESVDEYVFAGERRSGFYFCDSEYDHIERDGVRYWMPLPAPPNGVE